MKGRIILALLLPCAALLLQWLLWRWISPFVWFIFFPAIFFSARIGGRWGGMLSTVLSIVLVWFFFITPQLSWHVSNLHNLLSVPLFLLMGYLLSDNQERLQRAQRKMAAALDETRAANQQTLQLYQKTLELDQLKTQFIANLSHELRTPLTLIMSPLAQRLATHDADTQRRREDEMMLRNARLLYRQVSDLLDAAKLEAGKMELDYARIDLSKLIGGTAAQFDSLARDKGIGYQITLPGPLQAEVDGEKVQRIVLNLLSNAFKFTPMGGKIALRLSTQAQQALLQVEDNGPGIPQAMHQAVFERFRQVEGGPQRQFGGTGLGLAIVKEFAELHGGVARVESAASGGALFSVSLPLGASVGAGIRSEASQMDPLLRAQNVDKILAPTVVPSAAGAAGADAPLVLVVEDNPDMNSFISESLAPHYRVASAYDGRQGLESALALSPDLILSDVMMPLMSGDQMVAALRREKAMTDVPIIMLSARADDALRVRLFKEGVQDYLSKPFSVEELLLRVGGMIQDRQRFSARFSASEHRFEATFEQAAMGLALVAPDGHWLRVNHKLCEIVGYPREELLGSSFQVITHPDDLDADLAYVQQLLDGRIAHYAMEKRYLRKDGASVWINLTVALARQADGSPDYFIAVIEDIQQRKRIEDALKASEQALRAAQQLAGIGSWEWDLASNQHVWSEEIYRLFGLPCGLAPPPYPEIRRYYAPDSWRELEQAITQCIQQGVSYAIDAQVTRSDGMHCWLTARGQATRDAQGQVVALHGTVQDISQRKLAEQQIRDLNTGLERRVQERTAELTAANRELDSFAYAVSHDLRAPLRAMRGFSQALSEDYAAGFDDTGRLYLQQITQASLKMSELIDGILQLSRSTRGEQHRDRIDLSALAQRQLDELARNDPQHPVHWEIAPGLCASGDARMLEALMDNLLSNAWKYTGKTEHPQIRVYAGELDGLHGFCIGDNGAGFDMAHCAQLFQPFRRLHRQEDFPGLGIGLATVQRIVRRHGGEIRAHGEPGGGATFCFTLPEDQPGEP